MTIRVTHSAADKMPFLEGIYSGREQAEHLFGARHAEATDEEVRRALILLAPAFLTDLFLHLDDRTVLDRYDRCELTFDFPRFGKTWNGHWDTTAFAVKDSFLTGCGFSERPGPGEVAVCLHGLGYQTSAGEGLVYLAPGRTGRFQPGDEVTVRDGDHVAGTARIATPPRAHWAGINGIGIAPPFARPGELPRDFTISSRCIYYDGTSAGATSPHAPFVSDAS